jgi:hypothetical protein
MAAPIACGLTLHVGTALAAQPATPAFCGTQPVVAPGPPAAVPGDAYATVSRSTPYTELLVSLSSAPYGTGPGTLIRGYGADGSVVSLDTIDTKGPYTISGLSNGVAYTFTVTDYETDNCTSNKVYTAESPRSVPVTPRGCPPPVPNLKPLC